MSDSSVNLSGVPGLPEAMAAAIAEAREGLLAGDGGPFGAAVLKDGKIISRAHNTVIVDHDPTAHAEVNAIRVACRELGTHDLSDCILVATSEPCPMCLASSYWAGLKEVHFALGREVAEGVGFRDVWIDEDIMKPMGERKLKLYRRTEYPEAEDNFHEWQKRNGTLY